MTLNTDVKNTSDISDAELQHVLDFLGSVCKVGDIRDNYKNPTAKAYILLTRSIKIIQPEILKDPDVVAVRKILENVYPGWKKEKDENVKNTAAYKCYMAGKSATLAAPA